MDKIRRLGLSAAGRERIERRMQRYVDQGKVAGLVTVLAQAQGDPYVKAYGVRDLDTGDPMLPNTLVRIASLTKPVTAVATMMLVEAGKLALDDPVSRYIPVFDDLKVLVDPESGRQEGLTRPITVWHLLTHTSGLASALFSGPVESRYRRADVLHLQLDDLIDALRDLPLAFQPGEAWHYSISYDVLGYLVQVVADRPFDEFLRARVFKPLGMDDTGFVVPEVLSHRLATTYTPPDDGKPTRYERRRSTAVTIPDRPRSGGGGLVSTAQDYLRFMQMVLNGGEREGARLLQPETVQRLTQNALPEAMIPIRLGPTTLSGTGYGLGFGVRVVNPQTEGDPSRGTYWWAGITGTFAWGDPEEELVGILMTQAMRYYEPGRAFQSLVYHALRT